MTHKNINHNQIWWTEILKLILCAEVTVKQVLKGTYQVKISTTYYGNLKGISKLPKEYLYAITVTVF